MFEKGFQVINISPKASINDYIHRMSLESKVRFPCVRIVKSIRARS